MLHYSYFSSISRFPHKIVHPFQFFFCSLPSPYPTQSWNSEKKFWIHASSIDCGVRGGVGPVWIGKRPRNAKCPKTIVHDCSCVNYRSRTRVCLLHPVKSTQVTFHRATRVRFRAKANCRADASFKWPLITTSAGAQSIGKKKTNSIEISLKSSALWAVMMRLQKHRRERHIVGRSVIGNLGKFRLFLPDLWSFKS